MGVSCTTGQPTQEAPMRDICERNLKGQAYLAKNEGSIKLEGTIKTFLPESLKSKMSNYTISYRIKYGKQQYIWAEQSKSLEYVANKTFTLDYIFNNDNQMFNVVLEFKPIKESKGPKTPKQAISKSQLHNGFLTDSEANLVIINLQAYFDVHSLLMDKGEFGKPLHLNAKELSAAISSEETKGDPLAEMSPPVSISLKEVKPDNLKKIRFRVKGKFNKKNKVYLTISEMVGDNRKFIYETLPVTPTHPKEPLMFDAIEINTDVFEGDMITTKVIEIEAKELWFNKKGEPVVRPFAREQVRIKDVISMLEGETMNVHLLNNRRTAATITISEALIQPCFSFFDYKVHRNLDVIPIIAIDYSLSNLTFDNQKCIHSLKEGANNDYINVIEHITNAYRNISSHMLGFGMGARTIPKKGDTSNCFALSGNIFNPNVEKDKLFDHYANTLKRVELSLPVNYHDVLELASEYASYEKENYEARNYFVLIYVCVGVIDDFEETLNRLKEINDLPLTVIMVRVRNMQTEDTNDPAILIDECAQSFAACERKYLEILDFEKYKKEGNLDEFENELVNNIPLHVQKYMETHNVFAHDIEGEDFGSRMSIVIKKEQMISKHEVDFEMKDEVVRRQSMVNIKDFVKDLKENSEASVSKITKVVPGEITPDTAEEEDSNKINERIQSDESKEDINEDFDQDDYQESLRKNRDNEERKDTDEEDIFAQVPGLKESAEGTKWFPKMRRHSFSQLREDRFLMGLQTSDEIPRDKCEKLLEEGKLIEENEDNIKYLIKQEAKLQAEEGTS